MIGKLFVALTAFCCLIIVVLVAAILGDIAYFGWERLSLQFLIAAPQQGMAEGGIFPAIFGTFFLVLLMTIAVIPLGVMTAIYLHEYAPKKSAMVRWIRLAIENLAGVPAIVFGLFGLGFFIEFVGRGMDRIFLNDQLTFGQPAIIWAAMTLALLTLPLSSWPRKRRSGPYRPPTERWHIPWEPHACRWCAGSSCRNPSEAS